MPIFEFACENCGWEFEELLRSANTSEVCCPACDSRHVNKKISSFASKIAGDGTFSSRFSSSPSCSTGST